MVCSEEARHDPNRMSAIKRWNATKTARVTNGVCALVCLLKCVTKLRHNKLCLPSLGLPRGALVSLSA